MKPPTTVMIEVCIAYLLFCPSSLACVSHALGIRKATAWYSSHISAIDPKIRGRPKPKPVVLLLTDDVQNRIRGEKEGIECSSGKFLPPRYERDFQLC